jgi:nitrate/nitrite transporter NarK
VVHERRAVSENDGMAAPQLAPRRTLGGVVAVWVVAAVAGVAVGIFVPEQWRAAWLCVALGCAVILAFAIQLAYGRSQQFIERVAASTIGALVVLGVISAGFGLAGILPS